MPFDAWLRSLPIAPAPGPLLVFGLILIVGGIGGWLARLVRLPTIIGNLLAGVAIGPYALGLVPDQKTVDSLIPLSMFAIGIIMVSIGGHLSWSRIHNAWRRIIWIALCEFALTVTLVAVVLGGVVGVPWPMALLLAGLAGDTSPATIIHVCREGRAKGPFVKTLLSAVALDDILTITVFVTILTLVADGMRGGATQAQPVWLHSGWIVIGSILLGLAVGRIVEFLIHRIKFHDFSTVFIAILITIGLAQWLGMSPLLAGLFFGLFLGNASRESERQIKVLDPLEWILFSAFFTLAGVGLHLGMLLKIGGLGLLFVALRAAGKMAGTALGAILSGSSRRIWQNVPLAMIPQSSVAIALVIRLQGDARLPLDLREKVAAMVLAGVVVNEFIGPLTTKIALARAGELGKGRARLVEFIQEEFIKVNLVANDKWDAIRQLCDFLIRTHRVEHVEAEALFESVVEREKSDSTAVGHGAAIPHGIIEEGPEIQGVMAICRDGVDFDAPDGEPVRILMLIVTPRNHQAQHLKVLAALSAMISHPVVRSRLVAAPDANAVWEVIESEETPGYNYFLED